MEFIDKELLDYCEYFTEPESDLLKDLNRQTHLKVSSPRMLSGHIQGRFLSFLSQLVKPKFILEIGTYTGYSALCLAEGLDANGKLITIDPNEETNAFAKKFIADSPLKDKIELINGDAAKVIPTLAQKWDLVFIDADKKNYSLYYDLVIENVNQGGLIIADNVLWSGKVLEKQRGKDCDRETELIHAFNKKTATDTLVKSLLLPLRDGLMVLKKL